MTISETLQGAYNQTLNMAAAFSKQANCLYERGCMAWDQLEREKKITVIALSTLMVTGATLYSIWPVGATASPPTLGPMPTPPPIYMGEPQEAFIKNVSLKENETFCNITKYFLNDTQASFEFKAPNTTLKTDQSDAYDNLSTLAYLDQLFDDQIKACKKRIHHPPLSVCHPLYWALSARDWAQNLLPKEVPMTMARFKGVPFPAIPGLQERLGLKKTTRVVKLNFQETAVGRHIGKILTPIATYPIKVFASLARNKFK